MSSALDAYAALFGNFEYMEKWKRLVQSTFLTNSDWFFMNKIPYDTIKEDPEFDEELITYDNSGSPFYSRFVRHKFDQITNAKIGLDFYDIPLHILIKYKIQICPVFARSREL